MQRWTLEGSLSSGKATVEFIQEGDRIAHHVRITPQDGSTQLVWDSVEGTDLDDWPPSPPYQELMMQEIAGRPVALLVGMAGKSHWSLSVDIDSERDSIRFDTACRITGPPQQLGSTYRGPNAPAIALTATDGQAGSGECAASIMELDEGQWSVRLPAGLPSPATVRWVYDFRCQDAS